jgi:hypothetical protein
MITQFLKRSRHISPANTLSGTRQRDGFLWVAFFWPLLVRGFYFHFTINSRLTSDDDLTNKRF